MRHAAFSFAVVLLVLGALLGCEPQAVREPAPRARLAAPDETSARFQATIYEVQLPAEGLGGLNADALVPKAETPDVLEKILADLGDTHVAYAVDQTVSLNEDRIRVSKREPFVTNTRMTQGRAKVNTIQYEDVGVIFQFVGQRTGADLDVKVDIDMSVLAEVSVEVAEGVSAKAVRTVALGRSGPVYFGRPEVLVAVDASTRTAKAGAVAYVCRLVFDGVEP